MEPPDRCPGLSITLNITAKLSRPPTEHVSIEDGQLTWLTETDLKKADELSERRPPSSSGLLQAFTGLLGEGRQGVTTLRSRYGPLGLCKHGFALGHRKRDGYSTVLRVFHRRVPTTALWPANRSYAWRRYIAIANGVQKVVQTLHEERTAPEAEWEWIFEGIPKERRDIFPNVRGLNRNQPQRSMHTARTATPKRGARTVDGAPATAQHDRRTTQPTRENDRTRQRSLEGLVLNSGRCAHFERETSSLRIRC